jgi:hypothetical protein
LRELPAVEETFQVEQEQSQLLTRAEVVNNEKWPGNRSAVTRVYTKFTNTYKSNKNKEIISPTCPVCKLSYLISAAGHLLNITESFSSSPGFCLK